MNQLGTLLGECLLNRLTPLFMFVLFNTLQITVDFNRIQTWIVRVEGEHADH